MQAALNVGLTPDEFWELDEVETVQMMKAYQHRTDDLRDVLASNVAALINSERGRGVRKVKARDIFDREAVERERQKQLDKANETPESAARKQVEAQRKGARLPVPRKLQQQQQHRRDKGDETPPPNTFRNKPDS